MKLVINITGNALFYNRSDGTDLWMLADPHHLGRIVTSSGVLKASSGILTRSVISLAGWGVRIGEGPSHTEIPAGKVTMPDPAKDAMRLPNVSDFNTDKTIRPEMVAATPDKMPPTFNSMLRLRGGEVKSEAPDAKAKYGKVPWDFGSGRKRLLTHNFTYTVDVTQTPISLVFTRGDLTEWVELDSREADPVGFPGVFQVSIILAIDDVKDHVNVQEDTETGYANLLEWDLHHRCFVVKDEVIPSTPILRDDDDPDDGPISGADPMCPGGQIP